MYNVKFYIKGYLYIKLYLVRLVIRLVKMKNIRLYGYRYFK